jgi:hypothetical protein
MENLETEEPNRILVHLFLTAASMLILILLDMIRQYLMKGTNSQGLHYTVPSILQSLPFLEEQRNKQILWAESASGLYRQSHRRLSAKLEPNLGDRGVSLSQRGGSPTAVISIF